MKTKVFIVIGIVLMFSFGIGLKDAKADALLFPWIVKSATISTIISVVNTAETDLEASGFQYPYHNNEIYLNYFYKQSTANEPTEVCNEYDFLSTSSMFDSVTFDVSGHLNDGLPMFNDTNDPIFASDYTLPVDDPRRGFFIVTNNTDDLISAGTNLEGTIYGEAMIVNHETGTAFGYTAYNANPGGVASDSQPLYFDNGKDRYGEVIGDDEFGRTMLLPPNEYNTKFYVTPIMPQVLGAVVPGQQIGNANVRVQLCFRPEVDDDGYPTGDCDTGGLWNNTEGPISFTIRKNIVCKSGDVLADFMGQGAYTYWTNSGQAGWTYIVTHTGNLDTANGSDLYRETNQAVVGRLVYQLNSQEISFGKECKNCQKECLTESFCKINPWNMKCKNSCTEKCKYICDLPPRTVTTEQSDFQWIKGDDSMPFVHAAGY